jgi:hypothetical protein
MVILQYTNLHQGITGVRWMLVRILESYVKCHCPQIGIKEKGFMDLGLVSWMFFCIVLFLL